MAVWKPCFVGMWLVITMAAPLDLRAQTTTATLRGKAVDQQGAALTGVTVTARQVDTNTSFTVVSSDVGPYFLPNLPPGRYEVSAELKGFQIERRTDLVLQLGQQLSIEFTLKIGGMQEVVTVGANAPILETTKNTIGTIITKDDIDDLPTVERDFSSLVPPHNSITDFGNFPTRSWLRIRRESPEGGEGSVVFVEDCGPNVPGMRSIVTVPVLTTDVG